MRRPHNVSLRLRLTLLYIGLLAILLLALGGFLYVETRGFLMATTAARVRAQAKPVVDAWAGTASADLAATAAELSLALTSRDTVAVVYDRFGARLADGRRLPEEPVPAPVNLVAVRDALAGVNEVTYVTEANGERMLVALVPLRPTPGGDPVVGVVQLGTPLALVDAILLRQRLLLGLGVLVALVAGVVAGSYLTSSALRPLHRMIATCQRIAGGDLKQRVALPHRADEVGQLAAAFDEMAARIEAAFAAQRRFVADAAHELRTPITALGGAAEVLSRGAQDDPAATDRLLRGMGRDLERLRRMSQQLLDLNAVEAAQRPHRLPVDLPPFLTGVAERAALLAPERRIVLEPGPAATVEVDPDGVERVLGNLVDNAAQHTPDGGTIRLGWDRQGEAVAVWVADDGEGIAPVDLPHLFDPFYRGDRARSRRRGGTGLGLAIARAIVEANGGEIGVESTPGRGARFTVRLPVAAGSLAPAASSPQG